MRADTQQTLTITILDGPPQIKTRDDVDTMTFLEFASLTAVSVLAVSLWHHRIWGFTTVISMAAVSLDSYKYQTVFDASRAVSSCCH